MLLCSVLSSICGLAGTIQEVMWLRRLLQELGFEQEEPTVVYVDNQPTINMVTGVVPMAAWRSVAAQFSSYGY